MWFFVQTDGIAETDGIADGFQTHKKFIAGS